MAIKKFCDFCRNEIVTANKLPDTDDEITFPHEVEGGNIIRTDVYISVTVCTKEHSYDRDAIEKDICKKCLKELVERI